MKILITGGHGMLGRTLTRILSNIHSVLPVDRQDFDICNAKATMKNLQVHQPDAVIHCAAMTQVDDCETKADMAFAINAIGSANVASACHQSNTRLIAISTDYVFDGSLDRPYHEWDSAAPHTLYGQSKWAGEEAIRHHCPNHLICRTAWLYGEDGPSFLHTMLRLGGQEGQALKVVDDQIGNPTSCDALATYIAEHLLTGPYVGTVHLTCEGEATWYRFAQAIFQHQGFQRDIQPCTTQDFPRPAPRPANSRLEKRYLRLHALPPMPHWNDAMASFLGTNGE